MPAESASGRGVSKVTCDIDAEAVLQPPVQRVDPSLDAPLPDPPVQAKRLCKRPAVLEGMEAARREIASRRAAGRPGSSAPPRARRRSGPHEPGPARPEEPLVATRDEEVNTERVDGLVLDAESVDAVEADEQAPAPRGALDDPADRQLHARAQCTHVSATTRVFEPIARARLPTISSSVARAGSRYSATRRKFPAAPFGREAQCFVRREEVVRGHHHFVARTQGEASPPRTPQAHRGRVGQGDVHRPRAEVRAGGAGAPPPPAGRRSGVGSRPDRHRGRGGAGRSPVARSRDGRRGTARPCG